MKKMLVLIMTMILGVSSIIAQEMDEEAIQESYALRTAYQQMEIEKRERNENNIINNTFAHTVNLIPNQVTEKVIPLSGVTAVSDGMFGLAVKSGARNRIVDSKSSKLRSCVIFSCDYKLERGKILNITDDEIMVQTIYYYNGYTETKEIKVLPRTFSRLIAKEGVLKIVCSFE